MFIKARGSRRESGQEENMLTIQLKREGVFLISRRRFRKTFRHFFFPGGDIL